MVKKTLKIKPCVNKKNGQINFSLPKKKMPKKLLKELLKGGKVNIVIW